ncbi:MAG: hypothetical protein EA376_14425 [Phycisphaeraceae bacterium]|nr:MAG: hypothetical protein EA376_14425 [Phycisphaeraceae bacterium]
MPCLIALLALFMPRIVIILLVIFSDYMGQAYNTLLWPLLGFIFMPLTTLAYAFGMNEGGSISGLYLALVVVAVLFDLGIVGGSGAAGRGHSRRAV